VLRRVFGRASRNLPIANRFGSRHPFQGRLGFLDRQPRVILWRRFVVGAEIRDSLNDGFRIVSSGQSALRVGPIVFGLTLAAADGRFVPIALHGTRSTVRFFFDREIAEMMDMTGFLKDSDDEFFIGIFPIHVARHAKDAGISSPR
jgi:hypothetical protein